MNADKIERIMLEWIGSNYGSQEAEEPCYDIGTLAGHIYENLQKMYKNCPNCGTIDTEPSRCEEDKWNCNVCGELFAPTED